MGGANGLCFHRSVALNLDWPGTTLVIGLLPGVSAEEHEADPALSPIPFYHAWVEYKDLLYAPTTIERMAYSLRPFKTADYYQANEVMKAYHITRPRVLALAKQHGWKAHLLHGKPLKSDRPFAAPLLEEAGIQWGMSDDNGVVPIEYARKETPE